MSNYQPYNSNYGGYSEGGFNENSGNGGFNNNGAGGEEGSQSKFQQTNSIIPVTIKEINEATQNVTDGPFVVNNLELSFIKFVGVIREVDSGQANSTSLKLEDGTGSTTIKKWHDEGDVADYELGTYVSVYGSLREFSGKLQIQVSSLHKITDFNEVVYHLLDSVKAYIDVNNANGAGTIGGNYFAGKNDSNGNGGLFVSDSYSGNGGSRAKTSYDRVYEYIKEHANTMPDGVPMNMIVQNLKIPLEEVSGVVNILCEDGKAYSGINDTSFLAV